MQVCHTLAIFFVWFVAILLMLSGYALFVWCAPIILVCLSLFLFMLPAPVLFVTPTHICFKQPIAFLQSGCFHYFHLVKPPSHSDKDYNDSTAFLKLDKCMENGMKCSKKTQFSSWFYVFTKLLQGCHSV